MFGSGGPAVHAAGLESASLMQFDCTATYCSLTSLLRFGQVARLGW